MEAMHAKPAPDCLPAKLYLLACDTKRRRLRSVNVLGYVLRAGILTELQHRGCLEDQDGRAAPVGDVRTGDPMLDWVLRELVSMRPRKWEKLIQRDRTRTLQAVERQLEAAGVIEVERRDWLSDRVSVLKPGMVDELRSEASLPLLDHSRPALQVPRQQAALSVMAAVGRVPGVFTVRQRRRNRKRLNELAGHSGETPEALKTALLDRFDETGERLAPWNRLFKAGSDMVG